MCGWVSEWVSNGLRYLKDKFERCALVQDMSKQRDAWKQEGFHIMIRPSRNVWGKRGWVGWDLRILSEWLLLELAQWIRLRLPFCHPEFASQAHHLRFHQFSFELWHVEMTKIKRKEAGIAPFKIKLLLEQIPRTSLTLNGAQKIRW